VSRKQPHLCVDRPNNRKRKDLSSSPPSPAHYLAPPTPLPVLTKVDPHAHESTAYPHTRESTAMVVPRQRKESILELRWTPEPIGGQSNNIQPKITDPHDPLLETKYWSDTEIRQLKLYGDQMVSSPLWETTKIIQRALCAATGARDPMVLSLLKLYESMDMKKACPSKALSLRQSPLPIRYMLIPEEKIDERYQPTVVFQAGVVHGEEAFVSFEFGMNSEAERLFGYSRYELFNLYKSRRKEWCLARVLDYTQWEKVIEKEIKALTVGDGGFRLFITCINKWGCPIEVLLDSRVEVSSNGERHRLSFFFIPLPPKSEMGETQKFPIT